MTREAQLPSPVRIAIACGGTGGHLFPGIAVAERLTARGCRSLLLVSSKEVDQQAVRHAVGLEFATLPAVGLHRGGGLVFTRGLLRSYGAARRLFKSNRPQAALAMGGFTSVAPILAARVSGTPAFLHESNGIPGRANRWLSWIVDQVFIAFPEAASGLHCSRVALTGTPVRSQFRPMATDEARRALGLETGRPVLLVMGGSQGAGGINQLLIDSLPLLARQAPALQYLHLAGPDDLEKVKAAYAALKLKAQTHPFLAGMEYALGAATVAISRAGASSLAELAAMQVPAVLIPYPHATENHQLYNARALERTGAARLLAQAQATADSLAKAVLELMHQDAGREEIRRALAQWQTPRAAELVADQILESIARRRGGTAAGQSKSTLDEGSDFLAAHPQPQSSA
jgi:UDP-N-acetylglucosamine--N-acetylmuramyl-(pentapeptide) pyrophosphoryl-undecaprenol N-acetylglucosamine transferase